MKSLLIKSYAKINIVLNIKGKQEDGYHQLDMVMLPLALHDSILLSKVPNAPDNYVTTDDFALGDIQYNLATFAIPTDWGDITKITDSGGVMNYTTSFSKIGTFTRTIEGQSVRYNVWRWTSLPTVATGFTYRFYN